MRKWTWIIGGCLCSLLFTATVYAHLTGAFADFLTTVDEEGSLDELRAEIQLTGKEIERLVPRLTKMEEVYQGQQQSAVEKLRFYNELGLDTWFKLVRQQESAVDIMGSWWLIAHSLDTYMAQLNELYGEYQQLLMEREVLAGHKDLLSAIEDHLNMRQKFLSDNPGLAFDQLGNYLDMDWTTEVEPALIPQLESDQERVKLELPSWATPVKDASQYRFDGQWLNEHEAKSMNTKGRLHYFFRSDHIYAVFSKQDIHVILIGQFLKTKDSQDYALQFEAGYFNGFVLPQTLLDEVKMKGFRIEAAELKRLPQLSGHFSITQMNNGLLLQ